eukprot:TRINITY_DN2016_c0_g1_i6.p2 TRINITY_DN2016_c0_g1~~TRINITY_DN2016_c0_g1_i6.p2  ORF type:complete len:184 (-),score=26.38 TRINITY_DN2016_c0_g1_i6:101-652(-)
MDLIEQVRSKGHIRGVSDEAIKRFLLSGEYAPLDILYRQRRPPVIGDIYLVRFGPTKQEQIIKKKWGYKIKLPGSTSGKIGELKTLTGENGKFTDPHTGMSVPFIYWQFSIVGRPDLPRLCYVAGFSVSKKKTKEDEKDSETRTKRPRLPLTYPFEGPTEQWERPNFTDFMQKYLRPERVQIT